MTPMDDVMILGGGVIGLSTAYEAAARGLRVRVIDRGTPGQESSWAGAGILTPGAQHTSASPLERLAAWSRQLHTQWAAQLRSETGIDTGFRPCGGLYVAHDAASAATLEIEARRWAELRVPHERLDVDSLCRWEGDLAPATLAVRLPEEAQVRNPRHVRALVAACLQRGVTITPGVEIERIVTHGGRLVELVTSAGTLAAERYVLAAGAWSGALAARLGWSLPVRPVRGQIVLLAGVAPRLKHVINVGHCYLVPRDDGRVLVGATEEDVGFEKANTLSGVSGLLGLAARVAPVLSGYRFERAWSGLRPASRDGLPYLGAAPGIDNLLVAAGHFRQGLQLSCASAVALVELLQGAPSTLDMHPFRVDRA